jgi:hypothetical protein
LCVSQAVQPAKLSPLLAYAAFAAAAAAAARFTLHTSRLAPGLISCYAFSGLLLLLLLQL